MIHIEIQFHVNISVENYFKKKKKKKKKKLTKHKKKKKNKNIIKKKKIIFFLKKIKKFINYTNDTYHIKTTSPCL